MQDLQVRPLHREELSAAAQVIRTAFATVAEEFNLTPENCPTNGAFLPDERLIADFSRGVHMAGIFSGDLLVGFAAVDATNPAHTELEKLAVLPSHRHAGAGKLLVNWAAHTARSLGVETLHIGIIEENARLRAWYTSLGFIHTGTRRFDHLPFTVGFMQLPLSAYFQH